MHLFVFLAGSSPSNLTVLWGLLQEIILCPSSLIRYIIPPMCDPVESLFPRDIGVAYITHLNSLVTKKNKKPAFFYLIRANVPIY